MTTSAQHPTTQIDGQPQSLDWVWENQTYRLAYEVRGTGSPLLLLPAFSTVSSRLEMRELAAQLSAHFQVFVLDWLGFGQSSRPALQYCPALYQQLLQDFVTATFNQPLVVVAAGHAAGYAMKLAQQQPQWVSKLVLVAPTWKGPLCAMGAPAPLRDTVRELVRSPGVGQFLYSLNTTPAFLKFMYRRHVFVDDSLLTPDFMQQKYQITQQPGARFAPAAFVTGTLDPMKNREEFLSVGRSLSMPTLSILGKDAPPQSKEEMGAITTLSNIQSTTLPGTLGMHEEYATSVAEVIIVFLRSPTP